jgi:integral membrane sensor domain MASE1
VFSLDRIAHIWTFIVVGTLVPLGGGLLAAAILRTAGPISLADWRSWSLSEALGILLVAPIVIGAISDRASTLKAVRSRKGIEIALVFAGAVFVTEAVFGEMLDPVLRVPAYVLPLLLWPAFRFGPFGSAAMVFTVVFLAFMHTAHGMGPFALAGAPPPEWVLRSQVVSCVIAASFLLLAAEVAERKRIARENAALILELQQALAEIKTLRGFIPICAWCHKVRNDAGYWQQIESYLHTHTEATFSHGICPVCEELAYEELDEQRASVPS